MTQAELKDFANGYYWALVMTRNFTSSSWQPIKLYRHLNTKGEKTVWIDGITTIHEDLTTRTQKLGLYLAPDNAYLQLSDEVKPQAPGCLWPKCGCPVMMVLKCPACEVENHG